MSARTGFTEDFARNKSSSKIVFIKTLALATTTSTHNLDYMGIQNITKHWEILEISKISVGQIRPIDPL